MNVYEILAITTGLQLAERRFMVALRLFEENTSLKEAVFAFY